MGKLTVESIINIYGSGVKEIKTYNEAKRAKTEEFLQVEPVAFSLSDEPDVLRIYIDKESAAASLDGTLKENTAKQAEEPQDTEGQVEEIAKAIVDGIGKDLAAGLVEYYNLVKQLAEDIPGYKLRDTREIKRLLAEQLPEWDEEDWEDLRAAVEEEQVIKRLYALVYWFADEMLSEEEAEAREAAEFEREKAERPGELIMRVSAHDNNARVMKHCMKAARDAANYLRNKENDVENWQIAGINAMLDQCDKEGIVAYDMPYAINGLLLQWDEVTTGAGVMLEAVKE